MCWDLMREEAKGNWRILHNGELHDLYSLSNTVGRTRWAKYVARSVSEKQNANRIFVGKPEGRPSFMWEGINSMNGVILNVAGLYFLETSGPPFPPTQRRVSEKSNPLL